MGKIKVFQIGCGKMAKYTMRYVYEHGAEIVGAVDINQDVIGKDIGEIMEGSNYGVVVNSLNELDQLLEETKPDICVITTRSLMSDLEESLIEITRRGMQMPGAICGMWGVCGAVSSMGAALSIIDGTGPLSTDNTWGNHMQFTSKALQSLSQIGGPRCCKRDAFLCFQNAIEFVNTNYDVELESSKVECSFNGINEQCIKERCPFYKK